MFFGIEAKTNNSVSFSTSCAVLILLSNNLIINTSANPKTNPIAVNIARSFI